MKLKSIQGLPLLDKHCAPLGWPEDGRAATLDSFLHQNDFPAAIITTIGAGLVRHFLLMAVRALCERVRVQEVMSSPTVPPCLGMSSFRVWHKISTLFRKDFWRKNEKPPDNSHC
jgi:hypothetical protein